MIINISDNLIVIDGVRYVREIIDKSPQLADELNRYHGQKEYTGIVAEMIKWYYGNVQQVAWCAICVSYICNQLGYLNAIGGKNCNVNRMRMACQCSATEGYGTYYDKKNLPAIKKNDILFWLWKGDSMTDGSSKHVGIAEYDSDDNTIYCLGGNQKDKICTLAYDKKFLYAVYRIGG